MNNNRQEIAQRGLERWSPDPAYRHDPSQPFPKNDAALINGPYRIEKRWFARMVVPEGWRCVALAGGKAVGVYDAGPVHFTEVALLADIDVYLVDARNRTFELNSEGEFKIPLPHRHTLRAPVTLRMSITYRVTDALAVVTREQTPLVRLYERVHGTLRAHFEGTTESELERGTIRDLLVVRVRSRDPDAATGLEVIETEVLAFQRNDKGATGDIDHDWELQRASHEAQLQEVRDETERQKRLREERMRQEIAAASPITPEYLMRFQPELYAQLYGSAAARDQGVASAILAMIQSGSVPSSQLPWVIEQLRGGGPAPGVRAAPAAATGALTGGRSRGNTHAEEDVRRLRQLGWKVQEVLADEDGSTHLEVLLHDFRPKVSVWITLASDHPARAPSVVVEVDGRNTPAHVDDREWRASHQLPEVLSQLRRGVLG